MAGSAWARRCAAGVVSQTSLIVICSLYESNDLIRIADKPVSTSNNDIQLTLAT